MHEQETRTEFQSKALLRGLGLDVPRGAEVDDPAAVLALARDLGFPLVAKLSRPGLVHKSEVGGVALGLPDEPALRTAVERLFALGGPGSRVLIEEQVEPGVEVIVGLKVDPIWGPAVLVGLGGIYAEILRDVAVRLCPVSEAEATEMLTGLRGAALLQGARGQPPVRLPALARLVARLSRWPAEEPGLLELDCNPVLAGTRRAVIVDATVVLRDATVGLPAAIVALPAPRPGVEGFFAARSVAVVGASTDPRKGGNVILRNLLRFGFPGRICPVHPRASAICDRPAFPALSAIPGGVELAVVVVPREQVAGVLADAARAGTRHLIVSTAGFADLGGEGALRQQELMAQAAALGLRVMGPNSIGVVNAHTGLVTSITTLARLAPGPVALFGQSGTFASGYANWLAARGRPRVGQIACLGNKGDVDEADLLGYFSDDPQTAVLGLYTEGVGRAAFPAALARLGGRKPLVVLRAGRTETGRAAIASHTGSLAGDAAVYEAAFRRHGVTAVDELDELFLTLDAFDGQPRPGGRRVAVVSITGIGCVLAADAAGACGLTLPQPGPRTLEQARRHAPPWAPLRNPYDIWSSIEKLGPAAAYGAIAAAAIEDDGVDALLLVFVLIEESYFDAAALVADLRQRAPGKPVLATILGGAPAALQEWTAALERGGALVAPSPAAAMRLLQRLAARAEWLARREH